MINKSKTTKIGNNIEYAAVSERLKLFREACPNGSISTAYEMLENGQVVYTATVIKDKKDQFSADAVGHSMGDLKNNKAFEKLETIAIGRALAILGYLASGEIASSEEMIEFEEYQERKKAEIILDSNEKLKDVKTLDELKTVWSSLPPEAKVELAELKDNLKEKLIK